MSASHEETCLRAVGLQMGSGGSECDNNAPGLYVEHRVQRYDVNTFHKGIRIRLGADEKMAQRTCLTVHAATHWKQKQSGANPRMWRQAAFTAPHPTVCCGPLLGARSLRRILQIHQLTTTSIPNGGTQSPPSGPDSSKIHPFIPPDSSARTKTKALLAPPHATRQNGTVVLGRRLPPPADGFRLFAARRLELELELEGRATFLAERVPPQHPPLVQPRPANRPFVSSNRDAAASHPISPVTAVLAVRPPWRRSLHRRPSVKAPSALGRSRLAAAAAAGVSCRCPSARCSADTTRPPPSGEQAVLGATSGESG
ncbi:hypothetical protein GGTG_03455 [Gaeumannomyces tritici R3-111a-1]|uniref:Uncharacterized protein n=1 Tax=Gaeumannomyces tritici (strain R3-111a-1) TaxID=644352 RepID=J3NQ98_GAET3|nr:hypothetical protein GGTG_03455 [Gaeumannomyces tritici R3-111a-1]EJT78354.1 hypothetical protein GGTG_03455 [Gaeumannomyces tritici R3-111a-1]